MGSGCTRGVRRERTECECPDCECDLDEEETVPAGEFGCDGAVREGVLVRAELDGGRVVDGVDDGLRRDDLFEPGRVPNSPIADAGGRRLPNVDQCVVPLESGSVSAALLKSGTESMRERSGDLCEGGGAAAGSDSCRASCSADRLRPLGGLGPRSSTTLSSSSLSSSSSALGSGCILRAI